MTNLLSEIHILNQPVIMSYCDVAHVTKIDHAYEADAYFPDLDSDPEWEITADSDEQVYFDITYQFLKYERKKA